MQHFSLLQKSLLLATLLMFGVMDSQAQNKPTKEYVFQTFKDTRTINSYSVETLQKKLLDIRISHRFGDFFNQWKFNNAWADFIGLENAADIGIGVEYGVTNNLTLGFHRTKGSSALRSLLHGLAKYRILAQTKDNSMPITLTAAATVSLATAPPSADASSIASFPGGFAHRLSYTAQVLVGRKFGDRFSLQLSPTFVWRNLVAANDNNYLFSTGISAKIQLNKVVGILVDATIPFDNLRLTTGNGYYIPLGIGFEFDTGGHVFQINLTNTRGIEPSDYIPYTTSNWGEGQFRIGFTISRAFRM